MTLDEIAKATRDCPTHPGYEHGVFNTPILKGAADGCKECLAALALLSGAVGATCVGCLALAGDLQLARRQIELQKEYEAKLQKMYDEAVARVHKAYDKCEELLDRLEKTAPR
jgi:hypothetical protein